MLSVAKHLGSSGFVILSVVEESPSLILKGGENMNVASVQIQQQNTSDGNKTNKAKGDEFTQIFNSTVSKVGSIEAKEKEDETEKESEILNLLGLMNMPMVEKIEMLNLEDIEIDAIDTISTDKSLTVGDEQQINIPVELGESVNFNAVEDEVLPSKINNESFTALEDTDILSDVKAEDNPLEKEIIADLPKRDNEKPELLNNKFENLEYVKQKHLNKDAISKVDEYSLEFKDKDEGLEQKTIKLDSKDVKVNDLSLTNNQIKDVTGSNTEFKVEAPKLEVANDNIQRVQDAIVQLMETTTDRDTSVVKVKLYPEELGTVDVTLKMTDGKLTAKILVDNDHVKGLFSSKVNELNESLVKQNIHIEKINIDIDSSANTNLDFNFNNNGGFNHYKRNYSRKNYFNGFENNTIVSKIQDSGAKGLGEISILA